MQVEKVRTIVTQADLQRLDAEEKWVEVEDGEIVESENNMTVLHVVVIQHLYDLIKPYVKANNMGTVYTDGVRYILSGTPEDIHRARKPDFSFLRAGRIPVDFDWSGDFVGAPNLAVEVMSPEQTNTILLPKISGYLEAGSEEAWLIYPQYQSLYQYRPNEQEPRIYRGADEIDTSLLFPGLKIVVSELFVTEP